jgi:hypothetical protein
MFKICVYFVLGLVGLLYHGKEAKATEVVDYRWEAVIEGLMVTSTSCSFHVRSGRLFLVYSEEMVNGIDWSNVNDGLAKCQHFQSGQTIMVEKTSWVAFDGTVTYISYTWISGLTKGALK